MMQEKKALLKSPVILILLALSVLSCVVATLKANNIILYTGIAGALTLYAKRNFEEKDLALLTKIYVALGAFCAIVGVTIAALQAKSFMWMAISENFFGGVLLAAMVILGKGKHTDFVRDCATGTFWIAFGLAIIVIPLVIGLIVGFAGFVITLILGVLLLILAVLVGSMAMGGVGSGGGGRKYKDRMGFEHDSYDSYATANNIYKKQKGED